MHRRAAAAAARSCRYPESPSRRTVQCGRRSWTTLRGWRGQSVQQPLIERIAGLLDQLIEARPDAAQRIDIQARTRGGLQHVRITTPVFEADRVERQHPIQYPYPFFALGAQRQLAAVVQESRVTGRVGPEP